MGHNFFVKKFDIVVVTARCKDSLFSEVVPSVKSSCYKWKKKKWNYLQNKQKVRCRQCFRRAELQRARDCVFSSRSPLPTCLCLRCWHSNTNYTWNITPTHKNSLLSYVRWDPRWCLLSFAFFPFTNLAQTRSDNPGSLARATTPPPLSFITGGMPQFV